MDTFPDKMTISEKYGPAMKITNQAEADAYFERCVEHHVRLGVGAATQEKAEHIERANLGYFAGYCDHETRARVERLFRCVHPVFGSIEKNGAPTAQEAFDAGRRMASE